MTRTSLTPRPRVPMLVRATAVSTLALASLACGDDGSSSTSVADSDVHPTAGPCAHDPQSPECGSTGPSTGTTELSTGTTGSTDATSVADSATDVHPTAGPCAHDPQSPECATGTDGSSDSGSGSSGSGTGASTGSTGAG
ncbi:hypothetical protein [Paraliomyxa miuraensis]|uniref:hypothetical protein n=1 Tax=Paraliomyxa miuraensis TaxID=376150 RepID=UPI0022502168|nr:hypothetical protein [Paraliomyxa miuraensis]MCX4241815.1 hypothetical protein [Paraliomyxa miuraensis]